MKHPTHLAQVATWNEAFRVRIAPYPDLSDNAINGLRCSLLREELLETAEAIRENNRVAILDGLCDTEFVLCGAVLSWGYRSMWEAHRHTVTFRKIHDADAHLAKMLGIVNHLEIVSQASFEHRTWGYLVEMQSALTELVFALGFSPVFDDAFAEVARSNMTKLWRADEVFNAPSTTTTEESGDKFIVRSYTGKVLKPASYSPASLEQFV